ncbi:pilus assembly protein PilM [Bacillota bacterium LX-D]|nr:pilus assembly protein PilM [Bacillota bacterium LX-D]
MLSILKYFSSVKSVVGMEINSSYIKLVELRGSFKNCELIGLQKIDLPLGIIDDGKIIDQKNFIKLLKEIVEEQSWQGKQIAIAINSSKIKVIPIYLPLMPQTELKNAVSWELQKLIDFEEKEIVFDYICFGKTQVEDNEKMLILAAIVPKLISIQYYNTFQSVGLKLTTLDIIPCALCRTFPWPPNDFNIYAIIDIGNERAVFCLVSENKLLLTKTINFTDIKIIPSNLQLLINELKGSLKFLGKTVKKIILTGERSNLPGLIEFLNIELDIDVELGNPLVGILAANDFLDPSFSVAGGLALRGLN